MKRSRKIVACLLILYVSLVVLSHLSNVPLVKATDYTYSSNPGASGNDGDVYGFNATYSIALSTGYNAYTTGWDMRFGQVYNAGDGNYTVFRSFVKFDTSSIPSGATITSAKLSLHKHWDYGYTGFTIRLQKWTGDTPITTADFTQYDGANYDDGSFNASSWTAGYHNITISNFALITKAGNTLICIRSSQDINGNTPTTPDYVSADTYNNPPYEPLLIVDYSYTDTLAPTYTLPSPSCNTTVASAVCQFSCQWSDEIALSVVLFRTNNTGIMTNYTATVTSGWANYTLTLNYSLAILQYNWYANDTTNNWNATMPLQNMTTTPITTTIAIGSSSDDGGAYGYNETYLTAWSTAYNYDNSSNDDWLGQELAGGYYYVFRDFLKFNTSSIPASATVQSAYLAVYGEANYNTTNFTIRLQKWTGDVPIDTGDYNQFDGINYDDNLFSTTLFITTGYNNVTISNLNLITSGGNTMICMRSNRDISQTVPIGNEYLKFYTYEKGASYYPLLVVNYTISYNVAPTLGQLSVPSTVYAYQNVNVSIVANDGNGKADLHNITLSFNISSVDLVWTEETNATSKTDSNNYFNLVASYVAELNSTSYNVTWTIQIYWNSTKGLYGLDANTIVYDDSSASGACTSGQFTFVDDLVVASGPTVNCTRCNPSGAAKFSGQLYYQGTAIAPYTTTNITVYAELNGTMKGSNSSISSNGSFQITITAEASPLGTYTYNLYSLTDEVGTTNRTASFIVDRVVVTITISNDRIDTSINATITISGIYQTDSTSMTGSFIMNDTTYSHASVGRWNFTVQTITDTLYGLTNFTSNSIYCIWDKALIQSGGITLSYSHVGDNITVYYTVKYEYDLAYITDGNVFLNGSAMTYNPAVTKWERTVSSVVLGNQSWIITAINSNIYGITVIDDTVGAETCLYYANLNTRTVDVDGNPLTQAIVYMNNGTTGIPGGLPIGGGYAIVGSMSWSYQTVSSTGWANWTGLTNNTLQVYVKWYTLTVNSTFTLNITTDMNLDVACLCYPFNVSATMYWAASNATITSKLYVANILTLQFSSPMNTYQLISSCIYQPKYITNITYDYSSDFMLGYLTLPHYGNATLKLSYEAWGDLYVQKTDRPISAASLIGTNLTVSFMGNLADIGNVQIYCGSRGDPESTGGFTTATYIGGVVIGVYSFPSSTADLWLSWATAYAGPGYESNLPTSLSVILTLTFPNSGQPGQTLIGTLNVTWKGFSTIYLWSMMCEGTYTNWFLMLPEGLPKSLSTSNQTVSLLTQLKIPASAVLGQTQVPCSLTFATGQGNTKVFHVLVTLSLASPANVPDVLTFIFLGLIGSVIGVGLFAGERRRRKKRSSS